MKLWEHAARSVRLSVWQGLWRFLLIRSVWHSGCYFFPCTLQAPRQCSSSLMSKHSAHAPADICPLKVVFQATESRGCLALAVAIL